jgi:hypothetical protein
MTRRTSPGAGVPGLRPVCGELNAGLESVPVGLRHDQVVDVPLFEVSVILKGQLLLLPGGGIIRLKLCVMLLVQKERYPGPPVSLHVVAQTMFAEWELIAATAGMRAGAMKPSPKESDITIAE